VCFVTIIGIPYSGMLVPSMTSRAGGQCSAFCSAPCLHAGLFALEETASETPVVDIRSCRPGSVERALGQRRRYRRCVAAPLLRLYDLIVLDIALPGRSGIDWLHELRDEGYAGDVVLMTAYADLDTAIDALRAGAADFLLKPFSLAQMLNAIQRCFERSRLVRENFVLRRESGRRRYRGHGRRVGAMRAVCDRLKRIAPTPATVLLTGESGTGKEVAARALHRMSNRRQSPFVPVNCAAISPPS
jgi:DNA-binding NtrC family response regulator